jgi:hypothetical protein
LAPATALKEALLEPGPMLTLAGTVKEAELLERLMRDPDTEALFRVAVQEAVCPLLRLVGEQTREESTTGEIRLMLAVRETPAAAAVTMAAALAATCAALAVKAALSAPEATVTLTGTVRLALLLESATANPPLRAAEVSDTEQERLPGVWMDAAAQFRALSAGTGGGAGREMVPVPPEAGMEFASDATTPTKLTASVPAAFAAIWKLADARVPFGMGVVFKPNTTQLFPLQLRAFPDEVAAGPASTESNVSPAGRLNDHWAAVG